MVADAGYGVSTPFRLGLQERGLSYVLALNGKEVAHPEDVEPHQPAYGGLGPPTLPRYRTPPRAVWRGVYNRLRMWAVDGTWERVFTTLMAQADADEDHVAWAVSVDSTIVRAHQHAAGACKQGPRPANRPTMPSAGPAAD